MQIIDINHHFDEAIYKAIEVLASGGIIIYPTETCYGLGVDATNPEAVEKLLQFKSRREGKAISVLMKDQAMAEQYVELNRTARNLYENFLPGPLTVISTVKKDSRIDPRVASEKQTLGVRIPEHVVPLTLVEKFGKPITSTSANVSYQPNPYSLEQWRKQTPEKSQPLISLWLDAGTLPVRPSSTVVDTTSENLTVLRHGTLKLEGTIMEFASRSEEETRSIARKILDSYSKDLEEKGLVIGLQGDLGAGKTRFAQGIAEALKIEDHIDSPTFTIMHEYHRPKDEGKFIHIDTWRIESEDEFVNLRLEEILKPNTVVVIEWVEKVILKLEKMVNTKEVQMLWGTVETKMMTAGFGGLVSSGISRWFFTFDLKGS